MTVTLTDERAKGFVDDVRALRYAGCNTDPLDVHGMALSEISVGSRVLDVGCGTGHLGLWIAEQKRCSVVGIEPNPDRASVARGLGLSVVNDFLRPDLLDELGAHDYVMFMDVLEHCDDPLSLLALGKRLLAKNGKILISVPNVANWTVRLNLLMGRFDYTEAGIMDSTHLRWFTRRTIVGLIHRAGLRVVKQNVSRGLWMNVYWRRPLRWLGARFRGSLIDCGCRLAPGLFGVQHFIVAEVA